MLVIWLERARVSTTLIAILTMLNARNLILWFGFVVVLAFVLFLARGYFSPDARARRRREKSHRRVVSRRQGPTVRLAVDVDKSKRDRKG